METLVKVVLAVSLVAVALLLVAGAVAAIYAVGLWIG